MGHFGLGEYKSHHFQHEIHPSFWPVFDRILPLIFAGGPGVAAGEGWTEAQLKAALIDVIEEQAEQAAAAADAAPL